MVVQRACTSFVAFIALSFLSISYGQEIFSDGFENPLLPRPSPLFVDVAVDESRLNIGGQIQLLAEVRDDQGELVFNRSDQQDIVLSWESGDANVATVDASGVVVGVGNGTTSIAVSIDQSSDSVTIVVGPLVKAVDSKVAPNLGAINLNPTRVSLTLENPPLAYPIAISGVDIFGSPTPLDCGLALTIESDPTIVDAVYDGTLGQETLSVTPTSLGSTILGIDCDGFVSNQVVIEVAAPVVIPNPSPVSPAQYGIHPDLVVDGTTRHFCSYDQANDELIYAVFSGAWNSESVPSTGIDFGRECQIILDPLRSDLPTVCASDGVALKCFLRLSAGGWIERVVDSSVNSTASNVGEISAAVDSSGIITISYYASATDDVRLATSTSAARDDWQLSTILMDSGSPYNSLTLTPSEEVRIALQYQGAAYYGQPLPTGEWQFEAINTGPEAGRGIRLIIPDNNRPQVVYYPQNGSLTYVVKRTEPGLGTLWVPSTVETLAVPAPFGFGFDSGRHDLPRVSYHDGTNNALGFAFQDTIQQLGPSGGFFLERPTILNNAGQYSDLVVDTQFRTNIVYFDANAASPRFYVEPSYPDFGVAPEVGMEAPENVNVTDPATSEPTITSAMAGKSQVDLQWSVVADATYRIFWDTNPGVDASDNLINAASATSFSQSPLANGTTYYYRVQAVGPLGASNLSNEVSATPTNQAPVVMPSESEITIDEDTSGQIQIGLQDADTEVSSLGVVLTSSDTAVIPNAGLVLSGPASNRTLTVTPAQNANSPTPVTVFIDVSDEDTTVGEMLLVTVNPINDPTTLADPASATINEDIPDSVSMTLSDIDSLPADIDLTVEGLGAGLAAGSTTRVSGFSWDLSVSGQTNFFGSSSVNLLATDTTDGSESRFSLPITVSPVVDPVPPDLADRGPLILNEDGTSNFSLGLVDIDRNATISAISANSSIVAPSDVGLTKQSTQVNVTVTPKSNAFGGPFSLTIRATNGFGFDDSTFDVTVMPINDPPEIAAPGNPVAAVSGFDISEVIVITDVDDIPSSLSASIVGFDSAAFDPSGPSLSTVETANGIDATLNGVLATDFTGSTDVSLEISDGQETVPYVVQLSVQAKTEIISLLANDELPAASLLNIGWGISEDFSRVVFAYQSDLWIRDLATGEVRRVTQNTSGTTRCCDLSASGDKVSFAGDFFHLNGGILNPDSEIGLYVYNWTSDASSLQSFTEDTNYGGLKPSVPMKSAFSEDGNSIFIATDACMESGTSDCVDGQYLLFERSLGSAGANRVVDTAQPSGNLEIRYFEEAQGAVFFSDSSSRLECPIPSPGCSAYRNDAGVIEAVTIMHDGSLQSPTIVQSPRGDGVIVLRPVESTPPFNISRALYYVDSRNTVTQGNPLPYSATFDSTTQQSERYSAWRVTELAAPGKPGIYGYDHTLNRRTCLVPGESFPNFGVISEDGSMVAYMDADSIGVTRVFLTRLLWTPSEEDCPTVP